MPDAKASKPPQLHLVPLREGVGDEARLPPVGNGRVDLRRVGRGVPEQVLDVEFPGVVLDRPGGERMAEAVRVDLRDAAHDPRQ